jgi:DNA-binding MarR family transcriptional regulator
MASLRTTLIELESRYLSQVVKSQERDVYYAAFLMADGQPDHEVISEEMRATALCSHLSQPTYNRALKQLVADGYLHRVPDTLGRYKLSPKALIPHGVSCVDSANMDGQPTFQSRA